MQAGGKAREKGGIGRAQHILKRIVTVPAQHATEASRHRERLTQCRKLGRHLRDKQALGFGQRLRFHAHKAGQSATFRCPP